MLQEANMSKRVGFFSFVFLVMFPLSGLIAGGSSESDVSSAGKASDGAVAQGATKTVIDHAGNTVEIPVNPKRIGALHYPVTVMLVELEASIIGTSTRLKTPENKMYIRGVKELFNIDLEDTNYFQYGPGGKDIEQVKASQPDLLIGTPSHNDKYNLFSKIAPTLIIDHYSQNMPDMNTLKVYEDLARWIGQEKRYNKFYKQYKTRLEQVKGKFSTPPEKQTVTYLMSRLKAGTIVVNTHYGTFSRVAYDLGFQKPEYINDKFGGYISDVVSAEVIGEFANIDYILSTYRHQAGETEENVYSDFDVIIPGWRDSFKAYKHNTFIVANREIAFPISFKSCSYVLDMFEKHAK